MPLINTIAISLLLAGGAFAQSSSTMSSMAPAGSGKVALHVVKVSNKKGDLTFTPDNIKADSGDMVQFHFYPKKHSVVQSTFDQPCQPIEMNMPGVKGFFSGFMPVKPTDKMLPSYTIRVKDASKPMWFYCSQADHCQEGMVGVINPPAANSSRTIDTFKALAAKAAQNITPKSNQTDGSASPSGAMGAMSPGSTGSGSAGSGSYSGMGSGSGSSSSSSSPSNSIGSAGASGAGGSPASTSPATFVPGAANTLADKGQLLFGAVFAGLISLAITLL